VAGESRRVRYDNLKTAVVKILQGRDRTENERFVALRSHYGFESFFCEPGIDGAHEKGGVEGDIGWFRRNHLTPVPAFDTLADLNAFLERCDTADDQRWVTGRGPGAGDRVHALAALERSALWMLPAERFAAVTRLTARVDTKSRVCVRQCFYSVPARHTGQRVTVELGAETVTVIVDGATVAVHVRGLHRRSEVLDLDHYLEVLWRRPGALPSSTALAQARSSGRFRPEHQQFWDLARRRNGDQAGTRALCDVLLLHRHHPHRSCDRRDPRRAVDRQRRPCRDRGRDPPRDRTPPTRTARRASRTDPRPVRSKFHCAPLVGFGHLITLISVAGTHRYIHCGRVATCAAVAVAGQWMGAGTRRWGRPTDGPTTENFGLLSLRNRTSHRRRVRLRTRRPGHPPRRPICSNVAIHVEEVSVTTKLTSREFNQDTGGAKRAAEAGPVYITDRGRPSYVLMTFADYTRLAANGPSITDLLSQPPGIEDVDFEIPTSPLTAEPARFD